MGEEKKTEVTSKVDVNVFNLDEAELEKLAAQFNTEIVRCGSDNSTHYVSVRIPYTKVTVHYYN